MATNRSRKPAPRKRAAPRRKKNVSRVPGWLNLPKILLFLALAAFFFISIAVAGYVIFFRVVVAAELAPAEARPQAPVMVIEPGVNESCVDFERGLSRSFLRRPRLASTERLPCRVPGSSAGHRDRGLMYSGECG